MTRCFVQEHPPLDLTNGDGDPIRQLGTIQPIGFLIAVSTDWLISRASANTEEFIGSGKGDMVGSPLAEFLLPKAIHDLRNRVGMLRGADAVERLFSCELIKGAFFDVMVHVSGGQIIIEAEPGDDQSS